MARKFEIRSRFKYWSLVESVILTLVIIMAAYIINPKNPFFVGSAFPWIWFAPVLLALAYGFIPGIISVMILAIFFDHQASIQHLATATERLYLLGGFLLTILCAEFQSLWRHRIRRAQTYSEYASDSIHSLSKAYYQAVLSHDKLERYLINKPTTLRGAFQDLSKLMDQFAPKFDPSVASQFIHLLSYYCSIDEGAIYMGNEKNINTKPIAYLGKEKDLDIQDPLIKQALQESSMLYYDVHSLKESEKSQYLLATPIQSSDGEFIGIMTAQDIPFVAYNYETFQVLAVLLGYFADTMKDTRRSYQLRQQFPQLPIKFASEVIKLQQIGNKTKVNSTLMAVYFSPLDNRDLILEEYLSAQRGNDYLWQTTVGHIKVVFLLMPFTDHTGVSGYVERMKNWFKQKQGMILGQDHVTYNYYLLKEDTVERLLVKLMDKAHEL